MSSGSQPTKNKSSRSSENCYSGRIKPRPMPLVQGGAELGGHVLGVHHIFDPDSNSMQWPALILWDLVKRSSLPKNQLGI